MHDVAGKYSGSGHVCCDVSKTHHIEVLHVDVVNIVDNVVVDVNDNISALALLLVLLFSLHV